MRSLVVLAASTAFLLAPASPAGATIVVGRSIGGVKLGDSAATVKRKLGRPDQDQGKRPRVWSYTRRKLTVSFNKGKVTQLVTFSARERTAKGIGPGSTFAAVRKAYPGACFNPRVPHCAIAVGRTSTQFSASNGTRVQTVKVQKLLRPDEV